ncbi:MAG TPA: aspartate/glutamate racemase family protein [Bacteroidota bacterium]|nr:aspartate/glutamate racemase family protein [Bacteroidota bacterium]
MKTIGLIGGLSWESSAEYYRLLNQEFQRRLGGYHSAPLLMYSFNLAEMEPLQRTGQWDKAAARMVKAAQQLEQAGADFLLISSNTMHITAPEVERNVSLPLLHIADATAEAIGKAGLKRVGLLGTAYTMEKDFYKARLTRSNGLSLLVPQKTDREIVHRIIYDELCFGKILQTSKEEYLRVMRDLVRQGAEGIILGCTEISLLIKEGDFDTPLFDTTAIHVSKAVEFALQD